MVETVETPVQKEVMATSSDAAVPRPNNQSQEANIDSKIIETTSKNQGNIVEFTFPDDVVECIAEYRLRSVILFFSRGCSI